METREITAFGSLTLNPCFDLTLTLSELKEDDVNRVEEELLESAGKGLHVTCVLSRFGIPGTAFILAGEESLPRYRQGLPAGDYEARFITFPGRIRENLSICPPGRCLKINRKGFSCTREGLLSLMEQLEDYFRPGMLFAISGSWPGDFETADFLHITRLAGTHGVRLALDTDRVRLAELAEIRPFIIKPNEHELSLITGIPADTESGREQAVRALHDCGIPYVLLSLGGEGLILSAPDRRIIARVPKVPVRSTVGAGDSCLAGFLAGYKTGLSLEDCVRQAAACGTATAMLPGTGLATPELCDELIGRIEITVESK